jgi:hypothetical protein
LPQPLPHPSTLTQPELRKSLIALRKLKDGVGPVIRTSYQKINAAVAGKIFLTVAIAPQTKAWGLG